MHSIHQHHASVAHQELRTTVKRIIRRQSRGISPEGMHYLEKISGFYTDIYIKNQAIFDMRYPQDSSESIIFERVPLALSILSQMHYNGFSESPYESIDAIYRAIECNIPIQLGWYKLDTGKIVEIEHIQESRNIIRKILNRHRKLIIQFLLPKEQGITQQGRHILKQYEEKKKKYHPTIFL